MPTLIASPATGPERQVELFEYDGVIGNGSFGVVHLAKMESSGETVAIKKVLQDRRFKLREPEIMRTLNHKNVVQLKFFFYSAGVNDAEVYLNLILECSLLQGTSKEENKDEKLVSNPIVTPVTDEICKALFYSKMFQFPTEATPKEEDNKVKDNKDKNKARKEKGSKKGEEKDKNKSKKEEERKEEEGNKKDEKSEKEDGSKKEKESDSKKEATKKDGAHSKSKRSEKGANDARCSSYGVNAR
ncbi:unnamed protein product [Toxocara canis]|uniref:Protein kinase domain-containing protein n=1 Tax=Toxocara canis TaxID=6265 RepID=A0A183VEJ5_TOXCA|nr:unnamed protein product [Toxocara canis]